MTNSVQVNVTCSSSTPMGWGNYALQVTANGQSFFVGYLGGVYRQ